MSKRIGSAASQRQLTLQAAALRFEQPAREDAGADRSPRVDPSGAITPATQSLLKLCSRVCACESAMSYQWLIGNWSRFGRIPPLLPGVGPAFNESGAGVNTTMQLSLTGDCLSMAYLKFNARIVFRPGQIAQWTVD